MSAPERITQDRAGLDAALSQLDAAKDDWARLPVQARIALLREVKDCLLEQAEIWAMAAAHHKRIPPESPLVGEEWLSGPYAVMSACNGLIETLSRLDGKAFLDDLPVRDLPNGQIALRVSPHTVWDRLLLSGVTAEVWMRPGVDRAETRRLAAGAYDTPPQDRRGKVALVLGAGNIAAIAPLDAFHKLFSEHQVVLLKMNPVNEYLAPILRAALSPLIARGALRIVGGDGQVGAYLSDHPLVDEIHVTGAQTTHDAIVWGTGADGARRRAEGRPKNPRRVTSELGAVCPTIVVPGPWSKADIAFQAQNIATQKLHNSGFNCVACQVLILPEGWDRTGALMDAFAAVAAGDRRAAWYPGVEDRLAAFAGDGAGVERIARGEAPDLLIADAESDARFREVEVFGPALSRVALPAPDPEAFLRAAIDYANDRLAGTLGANILIHPATRRAIGARRFDEMLARLRYGCIAVNAWTGLGFLTATLPWGAFPGHDPADVGSGIGTVHNTFMLGGVERGVIEAPWRPFPRGVASGQGTLLPRPPWFVTNRRQQRLGEALVRFQHDPRWSRLPRIFADALAG
ncbi:hypothetical protein OCGS_2655 [Oceaniovalibus guishaninsula JLT2003]|uniref:Aldehyde dehydrogenase domain-containing protein n=1 Tax=Oceaniovalibus guishaninsula JLT2003 TaxID=1231392 RepID=K2HJ87_9RHOB|nr:aldehyde dehydrogenase family protein [Oceaniovalibus guishaninsula]EKE43064.1 hypothetical protein OCGS_2655 [Oceaniovalibus guishaninsula JLT2003]